jgi:hypothetical protein
VAALDEQQDFENGQTNRVLVADAIVELFGRQRFRAAQTGDFGQRLKMAAANQSRSCRSHRRRPPIVLSSGW